MAIKEFQDKYRFLSNFWPSKVTYEGVVYPTIEHAFQAAKTLNPKEREMFLGVSAKEAKKRGKQVKLREDWEQVKFDIMKQLLINKFNQPELKQKLLDTKPHHLEEGNDHGDTIWGTVNGVGQNHLGRLLMEVRDLL
jgi:ribA/ribD-fused uncharacterized protein